MRISLSSSIRVLSTVVTLLFVIYGIVRIIRTISEHRLHKRIQVYIGNETYLHHFPDHGERIVSKYMEIGEISPNCGLDDICPDDHFPVHIYTGKDNNDMPKICVSGKYVIQRDINNGGRGLNLVVVDTHRMKAVNARRFDTYAVDSSELEMFLTREVKPGDILIGMTFDEASKYLGNIAKSILADLGSSEIQNLQFRGQWFMITQNGMSGGSFTPYEQLEPATSGLWTPIDKRLCIPRHIPGKAIAPDPQVNLNEARNRFCKKHSYIREFCSVDQKNSPLVAATLTNRQLVGNPVFTTPIMVVAGQSIASLSLTLETLISQPGIMVKYVNIIYNPNINPHVPELAELFGFVTTSTKAEEYWQIMEALFQTAHKTYSVSEYVIVLEEGLLLAPDYLAYMATMQPLLSDSTTLAISAWNPNGYTNVSSRSDVAYRINNFPGLGFMMKMDIYLKELKHNMKKCCNLRGWEGNWLKSNRWEREIIVPELSRVLRRPVGPDLDQSNPLIKALFYRIRTTNLLSTAVIKNPEFLRDKAYDGYIQSLMTRKDTLIMKESKEQLQKCYDTGSTLNLYTKFTDKNLVYVLPFKDRGNGLKLLAKCFGLFYEQLSDVRGVHKGLLRFNLNGAEVILLSNKSPLFNIHPFNTTRLIISL